MFAERQFFGLICLPNPQPNSTEYSSFVGIIEDCFEKQSVFIEYVDGESSFMVLGDLIRISGETTGDAMDFSLFQL